MASVTFALQPGVFLTDGVELVEVMEVGKEGVLVQNVRTLEPRSVAPEVFASDLWREVIPA